ncbi:MAG TPA: DUF1844 domain-containing protein [Gemmatimonadales bacterium]|jgi:hypothetical protein
MNPHFASLVTGLAYQADQALNGNIPPHPGGEPVNAREVARTLIDTLGMLAEKTAGQLDEDETKLLTGALTALRFRFVSTEKKN